MATKKEYNKMNHLATMCLGVLYLTLVITSNDPLKIESYRIIGNMYILGLFIINEINNKR